MYAGTLPEILGKTRLVLLNRIKCLGAGDSAQGRNQKFISGMFFPFLPFLSFLPFPSLPPLFSFLSLYFSHIKCPLKSS